VRVVELWRYPVKSLQGERLESAFVGTAGIIGDRQWAIVDLATGLTLTARREPALLFAAARWAGPDEVVIELPDGSVAADDAALSAWLGRPVELRRPGESATYETVVDFEDEAASEWVQWQGPTWSFHDSTRTQVSIVTTGSIGAWDPRRFRANVVVAADVGDEQGLVGSEVRLGEAVLDVVKTIGRCVVTTRPQPGGIERDLGVLRTVNADRDGQLGAGALVQRPGRVAIDDELTITG